jgi:hypothetical protein
MSNKSKYLNGELIWEILETPILIKPRETIVWPIA